MHLPSGFEINVKKLFNVKDILNSKGFELIKEGNVEADLLIPLNRASMLNAQFLFDVFNNQESRIEILQKIEDYSFVVTNENAKKLVEAPEFISDRNKYSSTFEWYAGELMIRRFSAFSSSFGVEIRDVYRNSITSAATGDYDTLVVSRDINILYFECKTGGYNTDKILKFIERGIAIHSAINIMFIQDRINTTSLKNCLKNIKYPIPAYLSPEKINIKGKLSSTVYKYANSFFATASGNIEDQLRCIMRFNSAKLISQNIGDLDIYDRIGYEKQILK